MQKDRCYLETQASSSIFEERGENLSTSELKDWSSDTSHDRALLRALSGPGAKLLSGPRGCGKSTLLRRTYFGLIESKKALPVYVNYSKSLALEPLFHRNANALQYFRQWVLAKIVVGVHAAFSDADTQNIPLDLVSWLGKANQLIYELGAGKEPDLHEFQLSPAELLKFLDNWSSDYGSSRTVLLLDDAAHAFSHEQQRDFFEVFRELRSSTVAAKAAVYPGVTRYSPNFHVGHEAQVLEAWLKPFGQEFLDTMWSVVEKRMPTPYVKVLKEQKDIVDLLAMASFGIPRGFLIMLSAVLGLEDDENSDQFPKKPTRRSAMHAIQVHEESVRGIFRTLSRKLPRFKHFIAIGIELERSSLVQLSKFNYTHKSGTKAVTVAFPDPMPQQLDRIIGLLEYAGILRRGNVVSRGEKGSFVKFDLHYSLIISSNSLALGKSFSSKQIVESLKSPKANIYARVKPEVLLGKNYLGRCILDVQPCPSCNAERVSLEAKFCTQCGGELTAASVYESLLSSPVSDLPLTSNKIDSLVTAKIKTIQDILIDDDSVKIRAIPYIGKVWASRIRTAAEEFVSV